MAVREEGSERSLQKYNVKSTVIGDESGVMDVAESNYILNMLVKL